MSHKNWGYQTRTYEALRPRQSLPRRFRSNLPPVGGVADRPSLWPLGHGGAVDLGPRRWKGSSPCFGGFVLHFEGQSL
jgi:hypothetical protein